MGTHPIFESDFDCLTECVCEMIDRRWFRLPRLALVGCAALFIFCVLIPLVFQSPPDGWPEKGKTDASRIKKSVQGELRELERQREILQKKLEATRNLVFEEEQRLKEHKIGLNEVKA